MEDYLDIKIAQIMQAFEESTEKPKRFGNIEEEYVIINNELYNFKKFSIFDSLLKIYLPDRMKHIINKSKNTYSYYEYKLAEISMSFELYKDEEENIQEIKNKIIKQIFEESIDSKLTQENTITVEDKEILHFGILAEDTYKQTALINNEKTIIATFICPDNDMEEWSKVLKDIILKNLII